MAPGPGHIEVEGLKEFHQVVRRSTDTELPKRLGQANKEIGRLVIERLSPAPTPPAVGAGAGAAVRPSASKREVLLRVGGAHRASGAHTKKQPWGKRRVVRPGTSVPDRPYIRQTVQDNYDHISDEWLRAVADAMEPAFWKTEP